MVAGATGGRVGEESEEEEEVDVQRLYCATRRLVKDTGFSRVPCGVCPVSQYHVCLCVHERERSFERNELILGMKYGGV